MSHCFATSWNLLAPKATSSRAAARCASRGIDSPPHPMKLHRSISTLFVPALAALLAISPALAAGRVIWKSETMAQLKLQGRVPKTWNVYTGDKKKNLVLTLVGRRYLAL